jgi:hypothetical protein
MTQNKQHTNEVFEAIGKTVVHFQQIELWLAEAFRNRIVHSLWTVESSSDNAWIRSKGNIKSKYGFTFKSHKVDLLDLFACNDALIQIREWMICEKMILENATQLLKRYLNN